MTEIDTDNCTVVEQVPEPVFPPAIPQYREWPEYREYVRKVRCVICQFTKGTDFDGNNVEDISVNPEIVQVSDPHHIVTRGAGGPDAENLVSLCRFHHTEAHNMGIRSFQLHYNFDLKSAAKIIFQSYLDSLRGQDFAEEIQAEHNLLLSRFHSVKQQTLEMGEMLIELKDKNRGGKRGFEWLGFQSFEQYVSAPVLSGGLSIAPRTAFRAMLFWRADKEHSQDGASIVELGVAKTNMINPLLEQAATPEEKQTIIKTAQSLSSTDLVSWKNEKLGYRDTRMDSHKCIVDLLIALLDEHGVNLEEHGPLEACAWRILRHAKQENNSHG